MSRTAPSALDALLAQSPTLSVLADNLVEPVIPRHIVWQPGHVGAAFDEDEEGGTLRLRVTVADLSVHEPVQAVTIANLTPTGDTTLALPSPNQYDADPSGIDVGTRVLVAFQSTSTRNGIYVSDGAQLVKVPLEVEPIAVGHVIPVSYGRTWGRKSWTMVDALPVYRPMSGPEQSAFLVAGPYIVDDEAVRWETVFSFEAPNAVSEILTLDIFATYLSNATGPRVVRTSGQYWVTEGGTLVALGDPPDFGAGEEPDRVRRMRARIDGSIVRLEVYHDLVTDSPALDFTHYITVTAKTTRIDWVVS